MNKTIHTMSSHSTFLSCCHIILLLLASLICAAKPALAKKVYSPNVEQGELELEYQGDVTVDGNPQKNGTSRHQFELSYGVTDRWHSAVYGIFTDMPKRKFRYSAFKWENIYQLFEPGTHWLDTGLYLEYLVPAASQNTTQSLEFKLLLEKHAGSWLHTLNLEVAKQFGTSLRDTTFGYAWRSKWQMVRTFNPGFEAYGTIGPLRRFSPIDQQSHLVGPVLYGNLTDSLKYEVGYLFGLTHGSVDGNVKFNLELAF
ncbi:MAG: hypothetical protein Q9M24_07000 [Mariprofundaceae bacterium]|nr:hypothetical protein [Mariprofundaceae bacterium]